MQSINKAIDTLKQNFFNFLLPYTDAPYYILRHKVDKTQKDKIYINVYENILLMHMTALFFITPATFSLYKYYKLKKSNPTDNHQRILRRAIFPASLSFALTTIALIYEYYNDFSNQTKKIINQYEGLVDELKKMPLQQIKNQKSDIKQNNTSVNTLKSL